MIASIDSFKKRQVNAGVYLLNRTGWIILSTYVAGKGSRNNGRAKVELLKWCNECAYDVLPVHGQWDGVKESSFLIFTDGDTVDHVGLAQTYEQDCIICPDGLVWNSGKVQALDACRAIAPAEAAKVDHSTIDGEFFRFEFDDGFRFDSAYFVIQYESDELSHQEIVEGFQQLINSGLVWKLQGSYGRIANQLIESGDCVLPESE